jgi:hypothetical protein
MKLYPLTRVLSIVAYLLIFLQGMIIAIPFGYFLIMGLFTAEPLSRVLIALADIALVSLCIVSFKEKTKRILFLELVAYIILLLPLIRMLTSVPLHLFNYSLFIVPATCFVLLYPLSVLFSFREYKKITLQRQRLTDSLLQ